MRDLNKTIGMIALSGLKGIGPAFVKKVTGGNVFLTNNLSDEIKNITRNNNKFFHDDAILASIENAKSIVLKCKEDRITIISLIDNDYPILLREIKDPPTVIYCKGNIDLLLNKTIGIIGTREPNDTGKKIAERVGVYFTNSNWAICNGLAEGIDNYSIKAQAITHKNVIGVLAGGLNFDSKKTLLTKTAENARLIVKNSGLLISEIPPDIKEDTFTVVKSCRIQAGLSAGLIIIQSSLNGGSKFATKSFCEMNRPIGVINPIPLEYELPSYGANKEIIENKKRGLAKFLDIKEEKIQATTVFVIKSKEDYIEFESLVISTRTNAKLF